MTHSIKYQQAIEALARPVTPEDGVPAGEIVAGEHRLGIQLPSALREYYLIAGRLDRLNCAHNRLYSPGDWFVDAAKLVFMEENQSVTFWGIPISAGSGDDPPVLQGVNVADQPLEWYPERREVSCQEPGELLALHAQGPVLLRAFCLALVSVVDQHGLTLVDE